MKRFVVNNNPDYSFENIGDAVLCAHANDTNKIFDNHINENVIVKSAQKTGTVTQRATYSHKIAKEFQLFQNAGELGEFKESKFK